MTADEDRGLKQLADAHNDLARQFLGFQSEIADFREVMLEFKDAFGVFRREFERRMNNVEIILRYVGGLLVATAVGAIWNVAALNATVAALNATVAEQSKKLDASVAGLNATVAEQSRRLDATVAVQSRRLDKIEDVLVGQAKQLTKIETILARAFPAPAPSPSKP